MIRIANICIVTALRGDTIIKKIEIERGHRREKAVTSANEMVSKKKLDKEKTKWWQMKLSTLWNGK